MIARNNTGSTEKKGEKEDEKERGEEEEEEEEWWRTGHRQTLAGEIKQDSSEVVEVRLLRGQFRPGVSL